MSQILVENRFNLFSEEFGNKSSYFGFEQKTEKTFFGSEMVYQKQKDRLEEKLYWAIEKLEQNPNTRNNFELVKFGRLEEIKEMIGKEENQNKVDQKGHSYLYHACSGGNLETIEYFLGLESNKTINNKQNFESYLKAIKKGNFQVVRLFLQKGLSRYQKTGKTEETALHIACKSGNEKVVQELIKYHYHVSSLDSNRNTPLMDACRKGKTGIVEFLLSQQEDCKIDSLNKHNETALIIASKLGRHEIVKLLIKKGATINLKTKSNHNCALYEGAKNNHLQVVDELLKNGAYVDSVVDGWTSLLIASQNGYLEITQKLLQYEANLTYAEPQDGFDVFFLAAENGHLEVLEYLLQTSKNQNLFDSVATKTNNSQETLLHVASNNGHLEIVEFLIKNTQLNLDALDDCELTPLMCAAENDHEEIVLLLLQNGAKILENDGFQLEYLENETIKKLLQNFSQINFDFDQLFSNQQNCDYFITNKYNEKIGVHSSFVECRLGGSIESYLKIFQNYEKNHLNAYFSWLYSGILPKNDDENAGLIAEINNKLKINTLNKTGKNSLLSDLNTLFNDNNSKDFKLIVNGKPIFIHKFILIARSHLFSSFFKNYPKELAQLKDHSNSSFQSINILIKYLYTDNIDTNLNKNTFNELANALEYYQLNTKSMLDYYLEKNY
ncbi:hypothetical protein M0813_01977 [Anaeramoeba flamelloides]|uniref:BTB domain-containing protein n=1 Tax=Anaeramoeba flamelloides TaxID=1746091 RepID=A0ABQ8YQ38_9EUKA|nr:hypothetical protein M0813_01977 [Anaeramoeba flamelloides]